MSGSHAGSRGTALSHWLGNGELKNYHRPICHPERKRRAECHSVLYSTPTNNATEEKKDDFYDQLQSVLDRQRAEDATIFMSDFSEKTRADNTVYEDIMETHGLGQMNENGERFADLCSLNQLVIGGSIFPHKQILKATGRFPDHVTENQIDHICIS